MNLDWGIIICMLVSFVAGLSVGVALARPRAMC
jgi:hypothetical protein